MAHHRDLGVEDGFDGSDARRLAAFDLHRMRAGLDEASGVAHRFLDRDVVREIGHVADDERARRAANGGARVVEHVVDGDAERVGIAEDHHAEGVADEDDVGAGGVGDLRARIVVRGEHPDPLRAFMARTAGTVTSFGCLPSSPPVDRGGSEE